jgi:predicted RNase H-like HicB family nuclease
MTFTIAFEREEDGRWLAEVTELPGVLAYGATRDEAIAHAKALALRVVADRIEDDEESARITEIVFAVNSNEELGPKIL